MIDENMNERPEPEALGPETGFEDGTYGQCEACGGPIDEGRLAALPATRYCVRHQPVVGAPGPSPTALGDPGGGFPLDRVP
jgi:hypothetical protein